MKTASAIARKPGGRPRQDEIEGRLFRLLDVAADMFIDQGYAGTSIDRIAATAKIGKPTIYTRFENKMGLLGAVVDHVLKHRHLRIDRPISATTAVGALKEQLANSLAASLEPSFLGLFRLGLNEGARFPEILKAFPATGEPHKLLMDQIDKHLEFETLRPFKEEIASTLLSLAGMIVTTSAIQPGFRETISPESEASRFVDICLYGFFSRMVQEPRQQ